MKKFYADFVVYGGMLLTEIQGDIYTAADVN